MVQRNEIGELIKNHYNGYHFVNPEGEALYNSTSLMYFLKYLSLHSKIPEFLTDTNLKTDLSWVKRLTASNAQHTAELVDRLTIHNEIEFDKTMLTRQFNMSQFFQKDFYPVSFFYLGMFTRKSDNRMRLPNVNMKTIFMEYFNELHQIDVSSMYADMMDAFVARKRALAVF